MYTISQLRYIYTTCNPLDS